MNWFLLSVMQTIVLVQSSPTATVSSFSSMSLTQAQRVNSTLAELEASRDEWRNRTVKAFDSNDDGVTRLIADMESGSFKASTMQEQVRLLAQSANELIKSGTDVQTINEQLATEWKEASKVYERTAIAFEVDAKNETYADLKEDYVKLAAAWHSWSTVALARSNLITSEQKAFEESVPYIRRTIILLEHVDEHLSSLPLLPCESAREQETERFRRYVERFESLRSSIRSWKSMSPPTSSGESRSVDPSPTTPPSRPPSSTPPGITRRPPQRSFADPTEKRDNVIYYGNLDHLAGPVPRRPPR